MNRKWVMSWSLVALVVTIAQSAPQNAQDLSGVWEASSGPRRSIAEGSKVAPPMTPSGKARFDANKPESEEESFNRRIRNPAAGLTDK